ncbi:hypothetical protein COU54_01100 [Candidatus Pacearchaeota archaeon CG10_big_fil_rev_8_21_14_0_10_31_24]|nr:MAG: hypothetical protein COU54_01100 [Candidatus Pacearchaeota archaeon CG10_big_fil_rev_8_21_14_0_10_31_24]
MSFPQHLVSGLKEIKGENYLGIATCDYDSKFIEEILERGKKVYPNYHWKTNNLHIKKLKIDELTRKPAMRFENSLKISRRFGDDCGIPIPLALIYQGTTMEILTGKANGYFITQYVPGNTLIQEINKMPKTERDELFVLIKLRLNDYSRKGFHLLDFAPRDIILFPIENSHILPIFADTEHLELTGGSLERKQMLLAEQKKQFKIDYEDYLSRRELKNTLDILFE